jgi:hypothetical protein
MINKDKTSYKQSKVDFMRHTINFDKIEPKVKKIQAIDDMGSPKDKKQL